VANTLESSLLLLRWDWSQASSLAQLSQVFRLGGCEWSLPPGPE
jgi:hypothetical protein